MSEFYQDIDMNESNNMDLCMIHQSIELFKPKYYLLKNTLHQLCNSFILFDHDCPIGESELNDYLTIENIMELCRICHDYFLCRNQSIILSAQHILDKIVITDDSPKDELYMYFTAYIFMIIVNEPHKHQDLFDLIMDVSNYYSIYLNGQEKIVFEMIGLEEMLSNIRL